MIQLPDRIGPLIAKLEAGEDVSQWEVDRLAALQALDIARIGTEFAQEAMRRDDEMSRGLE